jgi:uncharacterized membrane protein YsdA (DUF1294 family)
MSNIVLIYLISVNVFGAILFYSDKHRAIKSRDRISEKTLHILEFSGAVFSVLLLMYVLHHKNRKPSYYLLTYLALLLWAFILIWYLGLFPFSF